MNGVNEVMKIMPYFGILMWVFVLLFFIMRKIYFPYAKLKYSNLENVAVFDRKIKKCYKHVIIVDRFVFAVTSVMTVLLLLFRDYSSLIIIWSMVACIMMPSYFISLIDLQFFNKLSQDDKIQ